jgi:hypothetical protein
MAGADHMRAGMRDNDLAKAKQGAFDFVLFHAVLPVMFHTAQQGFYIDDILDPDKGDDDAMMDDNSVIRAAILGNFKDIPFYGDLLMNVMSYYNTGHAYDVGVGVFSDILEEGQDLLQFAVDLIQEGGDELSADDWVKHIAALSTVTGIPTHSLYTLGSGIGDFIQGKTHDARALGGFSSTVLGKYERSLDYPLIHKNLPQYGGDLAGLYMDVIEDHDMGYFLRNKERLQKEYVMYSVYGSNHPHVNNLYSSLRTSDQRATYLDHLYQLTVEGKMPLAMKFKTPREWTSPEEYTHDEFLSQVAEWKAFGVITDADVMKFIAKNVGIYDDLKEILF